VGVAAGIGHQPGRGDLGAGDFGQAVDRFLLQGRRPVLVTIPLGIGVHVEQPEIGRQVDDFDMGGQGGDHLLGGAVRQAAEHRVNRREVHLIDGDQIGQGQRGEVGEHRRHGLARLAVAGHDRDAEIGMQRQQAHQFGPGVTAGPQDRDLNLVHDALLQDRPMDEERTIAAAAASDNRVKDRRDGNG
jgi:hypothetical protein